MVCEDCIGAHDEDDRQDAEKHVDQAPPGVVRVVGLDVGDDGADEGNDPAGLLSISKMTISRSCFHTHNANAYGAQPEWVTGDVAKAELAATSIAATHLHFLQRRRVGVASEARHEL